MASASYDGVNCANSVKVVRAAICAERRRAGKPGPRRDGLPENARPARASRSAAITRGVGASVAIASGYVALVTWLRWLLSLA